MTKKKTPEKMVNFEVFIQYSYPEEWIKKEKGWAPDFGTVKGEREFWKDAVDPAAKKTKITVTRWRDGE